MGRLEIHRVILIREKEPLLRCTNVGRITVNLNRVVAPFSLDPLRSGPLANAPRWIFGRATRLGSMCAPIVPLCLAPVALTCELKERRIRVTDLGAHAVGLVMIACRRFVR